MIRSTITRWGRNAIDAVLVAVIATGVAWRMMAISNYVSDSGDEWGNTIAPFRVLLEGGDPKTFFHPSLYYYVVAAVYGLWFQLLKLLSVVGDTVSMTDLFVRDTRYFVLPARAVSATSAILTIWAVYRLACRMWDRRAGLMAASLLAALPLHLDYSKTVRVDAFAVLMVVWAIAAIAKIPENPTRSSYDKGGLVSGLATGANYNGALTVCWLFLAHAGTYFSGATGSPSNPPATKKLFRALSIALVTFVITSPFILLNVEAFSRNFGFIAGMAAQEHVGWEGRDLLFYARDLMEVSTPLALLIGLSSVVMVLGGSIRERLVASFPIAYFAIFSLISSKDERFILPALPLFLVVASGLPNFVMGRYGGARRLRFALTTVVCGLLLAGIYTMLAHPAGARHHTPLDPPDEAVFAWLEKNSRSGSKVVVESGVILFLDTLSEEGRLAREMRSSMVRVRPGLNHEYIGVIYIGGNNYDPAMVASHSIDYAIVSQRTVRNIGQRCQDFPRVCEFHRLLREEGRLVFETPEGIEGVSIYEIRREKELGTSGADPQIAS